MPDRALLWPLRPVRVRRSFQPCGFPFYCTALPWSAARPTLRKGLLEGQWSPTVSEQHPLFSKLPRLLKLPSLGGNYCILKLKYQILRCSNPQMLNLIGFADFLKTSRFMKFKRLSKYLSIIQSNVKKSKCIAQSDHLRYLCSLFNNFLSQFLIY